MPLALRLTGQETSVANSKQYNIVKYQHLVVSGQWGTQNRPSYASLLMGKRMVKWGPPVFGNTLQEIFNLGTQICVTKSGHGGWTLKVDYLQRDHKFTN